MRLKQLILILLSLVFISYSIIVYTEGTASGNSLVKINPAVIKGKMVWQQYNCSACHQIYGLGGYLGPDLTNVVSTKGTEYIKVVIQNGLGRMPNFKLNKEQVQSIVAYLSNIDSSTHNTTTILIRK